MKSRRLIARVGLNTTVGDVVRALETLRSVGPERTVAEVLEMMGREDVSQMPVV